MFHLENEAVAHTHTQKKISRMPSSWWNTCQWDHLCRDCIFNQTWKSSSLNKGCNKHCVACSFFCTAQHPSVFTTPTKSCYKLWEITCFLSYLLTITQKRSFLIQFRYWEWYGLKSERSENSRRDFEEKNLHLCEYIFYNCSVLFENIVECFCPHLLKKQEY